MTVAGEIRLDILRAGPLAGFTSLEPTLPRFQRFPVGRDIASRLYTLKWMA
jgi:hypothetical protein